MAYLPTSQRTSVQQEQDQNQVQPQAAALPTSSASGGAAAPGYGQPTAAAPQQAQPSATYPMITDYLRANEGAGKAMAADVSNRVGSEATGAKQQADKAQADWTTQNQGAIDQWRQAVSATDASNLAQMRDLKAKTDAPWVHGPTYGGVTLPTGSGSPIAFQPGSGGVALRNIGYDRYRGDYSPQARPSLTTTDYSTPGAVTSAQSDVNAALNALGTDYGREALMAQGYGGRAPYSGGAAALDAALLGRANPEANLRAQYGDIIGALTAPPVAPDASAIEEPWQLSARWGIPDPANGNPEGFYRNG